jgi:hypothetical protein
MAPRLGAKYPIEIEMTSKPRAHYKTPEYMELDLPAAPAIMAGDEVVAEGSDIPEHKLETAICRHLGLPEPQPPKEGILSRFLKR